MLVSVAIYQDSVGKDAKDTPSPRLIRVLGKGEHRPSL